MDYDYLYLGEDSPNIMSGNRV